MKKIFLTSAGFTNKILSEALLKELVTQPQETSILVIAYAQNKQEQFYVNESKKELENLGFKRIQVLNMHNTVDIESLKKFDIVYVCGGNTFAILNKLRETKLDQFIIDTVNTGTIYVGVSAGSIIAGPDIEIAGWGSEGDKNEINLTDLRGFNLVNVAIFPHFHDDLRSEVEEFKKKVSYEVIELTNDEAVLIKNNQVERI